MPARAHESAARLLAATSSCERSLHRPSMSTVPAASRTRERTVCHAPTLSPAVGRAAKGRQPRALSRDAAGQCASHHMAPIEATPRAATRPRRAPVWARRATRARADEPAATPHRVLPEIVRASLPLDARRPRTDDAEQGQRRGLAFDSSRRSPTCPRLIAPPTRRACAKNHDARALPRASTKGGPPPDAPNRLDTLSRSAGAPSRCIVPGMQNRYLSPSRSISPPFPAR